MCELEMVRTRGHGTGGFLLDGAANAESYEQFKWRRDCGLWGPQEPLSKLWPPTPHVFPSFSVPVDPPTPERAEVPSRQIDDWEIRGTSGRAWLILACDRDRIVHGET